MNVVGLLLGGAFAASFLYDLVRIVVFLLRARQQSLRPLSNVPPTAAYFPQQQKREATTADLLDPSDENYRDLLNRFGEQLHEPNAGLMQSDTPARVFPLSSLFWSHWGIWI